MNDSYINEFYHDVRYTQGRYDSGVIDFKQWQIELSGYLVMLYQENPEMAFDEAKKRGLDLEEILNQ